MVRNKYYVVRKLADVIYALPVGQGIVRDYPVMQLGALEYDIPAIPIPLVTILSMNMIRYLMN